ncbi:uncharacterized protein LOC127704475 [Mytilus californianus]|uniref:uncharacterized protein LOC127704475 n=1 Tax=Mytilus californianus TaxID=6549 RepID=UPI0022485DA9|nr:uncharacterized protein LOC127704475 [Mytilus californianus]
MASSSQSCGVCDRRYINKPLIVWCVECEEGLCEECLEHHSLSKGSRNHKTISITEYHKIPSEVLMISRYCSTHKDKFILYCRKHELPCCSQCIVESHTKCHDIDNLDDVIQNVKTSKGFYEIEETLIEVTENLQKIRQHQQANLLTLGEKRKEFKKEMKETRRRIIKHLDKLQDDFIKQYDALENKENSKIRQLLSSLELQEKEIDKYQKNIATIKQHATDLQLFLSIKQIEKNVMSKDNILHSLIQGKALNFHALNYKINTAIQNVTFDIKSFGEIYLETEPCDIALSRKKTKQAQILVPAVESRSVEKAKLQISKQINMQGTNICGCCILPDGRLTFTYFCEKTVKVFNIEGSKVFEIKIPSNVYDIVYIRADNTFAVTSGTSRRKCITIIDFEKEQIKQTIPLESFNFGISLKRNKLVYSSKNKGIQMLNPRDNSFTDIVRDEMPSDCYTATFGDNIYHSNQNENAVACYDSKGKLQWTFRNKSVLKNPRGIAVDTDGNVYVAGMNSQNVVFISPNGKQNRVVLDAKDGLNNPTSLCISKSRKQLLVANCDYEAHVFDFI